MNHHARQHNCLLSPDRSSPRPGLSAFREAVVSTFSVVVATEDGLSVAVECQLDQNAYAPEVLTDIARRAVVAYHEALIAQGTSTEPDDA